MDVMLKKNYEKELKKKEAVNETARDYSEREENRIKYDKEHPLVIDDQTQILELSILPDEDDGDENLEYMRTIGGLLNKKEKDFRNVTRKVIRVRFKDMEREYENEEEEQNPYFVDINTTATLEELEQKLEKCTNEDDIYDLNES